MPSLSVVAAVAPPTARVANLGGAVATVALAGLPAAITVARGGTDVGAVIVLLVLGTGASLAWAVDDPAADVLDAAPVGAPFRTAVRVVAVALVALVLCAAFTAVLAAGPGLPGDVGDRLPEGLAAGAIALAAGLVAATRGERAAGPVGVLIGMLVPAAVAGFAMRWPDWLPTFQSGAVHARWWLLVVAALAVVAVVARDPARR